METYEEELLKYQQSLLENEQKELLDNALKIENFKVLCLKKGVQLMDSNFKYIRSIGIVASYPNLLSYLSSAIEIDKEGLVNYKKLDNQFIRKETAAGFCHYTDFIIMAHPFYRRGYNENSNFAPSFIDLFWGLEKPGLDLYIAIDINRVRIQLDNSFCIERDTWYGARFNKEIHMITNNASKLRPPQDLNDRYVSFFYNNAYSLDTLWTEKEHIKTFQAEEFKTEEIKIQINGKDYHPVRYIHAEFDLEKKTFRHFDGAVHIYNEVEYYQRRDSDLKYNSKHNQHIKTLSKKLFKMNGSIDVDTFVL